MTPSEISSQATSPAHEARLLSRHNLLTNTSGIAPGYLQANLIVLPSRYAEHFRALCARNPVSCPLLGVTPRGDPHTVLPAGCIKTAEDFDIRTDFPCYRVYDKGKCVATKKPDIKDLWTPDHVGFLIGCSFSFEDALAAAGLTPRHQTTNTVVAMYRSSIPVLPAGIFTDAQCVVSMRPYRPEDVEKVRDVTRPFLATHGEPVAWGWEGAREIGVRDVDKPDFGQPQRFEEGEVPVFWACGVTPQLIVESAGDKIDGLVFAHEPGHMLVTDWTTEDLDRLRAEVAAV
ncbi:hypothetical protein VTN96DRAFT_10164 [Rasamsonia emersonii]|uniref:DUF1445 domain protein n=1 Tax=Rasamsonia emersonii (strain ATCC 16479 / CBS 393.64 / IMI 116815) TaxID=1408163 RepID=A0A0F4Z2N8_RASE3|nr:Uncharacterized protein T310_1864 [Rasamsonia emersonii CBS 393.64]KKA24133.1 Uncharacterized protein T310_1864 [Rasamsonia emersonii CBS 393.64]